MSTVSSFQISQTSYSACLVITDSDKSEVIGGVPTDEDIVYHRLDLKPDVETCNYDDTEVTRGNDNLCNEIRVVKLLLSYFI